MIFIYIGIVILMFGIGFALASSKKFKNIELVRKDVETEYFSKLKEFDKSYSEISEATKVDQEQMIEIMNVINEKHGMPPINIEDIERKMEDFLKQYGDEESTNSTFTPPDKPRQLNLNEILDKISEHGEKSLTDAELDFLKNNK